MTETAGADTAAIETAPVNTGAETTTTEETNQRSGEGTFRFMNDSADKNAFEALVPQEYKEQPWAKNILQHAEPNKEFFKQMANLQQKIGQKPTGLIPPTEQSTPEEIQAFYKQLGVPDDANQYEIPPTEFDEPERQAGELLTKMRNDQVMSDFKKAAKELGMTAKQVKGIAAAFEKSQAKVFKDQLAKDYKTQMEQGQDFDLVMNNMFGQRATQVMDNGKKLLDQTVPAHMKPMLKTLDNKSLAILAAALDGVNTRYVREGGFSGTQAANSGGLPATTDEIRSAARKLMADPAFGDPQNPRSAELQKQVAQIYSRLPKDARA